MYQMGQVKRWIVAVLALVVLLPGVVAAQVISDQQLDYLRQQFIEAVSGSVDGSFLQDGTVAPVKLSGRLPANKIVEADEKALAELAAFKGTTESAVSSVESQASGLSAVVQELVARVAALESQVSVWNLAASRAESWANSTAANTAFTTNFVVLGASTNAVIVTVLDGVIKDVQE